MNKEAKIELRPVEDTKNELTKEEQRKLQRKREREEKKMREYMNSMIRRSEAFSMAEKIADRKVEQLAEFIRDPLRVNLVQTMAVIELLMDKGIIESQDEFQKYLDKIADALQQEGDSDGGKEKEKETDSGEGNNEKEKEFKS